MTEIKENESSKSSESATRRPDDHDIDNVTSGNDDDAPSTSKTSKKKKNKGKGKLAKLKEMVKSGDDKDKETAVFDLVRKEVEQKAGVEEAQKLTPEMIAEILKATNMHDYVTGKSGPYGKNKKDMASYKFWATQPVLKIGTDPDSIKEGALEENKNPSDIRQTPLKLPGNFEWVTVDLDVPEQIKEVYELLTYNYVEDDDAAFRFNYTAEFIQWALKPPGYQKEWHIGVRVASTKKLVAFIAGIPVSLRAHDIKYDKSVEINFLCIHKKLRGKRLAPVLIQEVTRRSHVKGVFQAIYTAGAYLPTPVARNQYFHRALNHKKLVATGFESVPPGQTMAQMLMKDPVPKSTSLNLREITDADVPQVLELMKRYLARFELICGWTEEDVRHTFVSKHKEVTWTYVVEDPKQPGAITDFVSYYSLPSSALQCTTPTTVNAAYLFYYATTSCPACSTFAQDSSPFSTESIQTPAATPWYRESPEQREVLKNRLNELISDVVVLANKEKFDVFNALTLMDNNLFLDNLAFKAGDGYLHWYLYNWAVKPIPGGAFEENDGDNRSGVGMVML